MADENWASLRLTVTLSPRWRDDEGGTLEWRLSAKAPGGSWNSRETVDLGTATVWHVSYPPSRAEMLALLGEVVQNLRWAE